MHTLHSPSTAPGTPHHCSHLQGACCLVSTHIPPGDWKLLMQCQHTAQAKSRSLENEG